MFCPTQEAKAGPRVGRMALPSLTQAKGPGQARGRAQQVPESTQGLEQLQGWGTAMGNAPPQGPSWCMARRAGPSSLALAGGVQVQASSGRGMPCWDPNSPGSQWQGCLPAVPGVTVQDTGAGPVSSLDEHLVAESTHEHCLLLSLWRWKGKQMSEMLPFSHHGLGTPATKLLPELQIHHCSVPSQAMLGTSRLPSPPGLG